MDNSVLVLVAYSFLYSQRPPLSPVNSLHSPAQPLLTSTGLEKSPEGSLLKSTDLDQQLQDFVKAHKGMLEASDKDSVITMATLSQSSHLSVNNVAILCAEIEVFIVCYCCYLIATTIFVVELYVYLIVFYEL